jgi:4-amino-4-deoxy-L-arabinose transferase-like glycosyltransferase
MTEPTETEPTDALREAQVDPPVTRSVPERGIPPAPGVQAWRQLFRWHFVVLLAVMVFFGAIRWRLLDMPLERDEGEYAYAGQLMLQGIPPYQLAYNMKLPGIYAAYAAILAVFGQTGRGIHLGLLLVNGASVILLYLVTARLFGALAGTIAGASYALLSTHQGVLGFAAHATHFIVLAALIGIILLLQAEETGRTALFFWSGLAFGIAFLMKQPGILLGAFAFFYLAVQCWPKNADQWAPWGKKLGIFLLGGVLPFALTCALLYRAGVFRNFWFWTFDYARQYSTILPLREGAEYLTQNFSYILRFTPWLWVLALAGLSTVFWNPTVRRHAVFVFGLLAFSCAAVCPGLYFRPHYFVLMLPAVAILIAVAVTSAIRLLTTKFTSRWLHALPVIAFAAASALAIHRNAGFYFKLTPVQASHLCYRIEPFTEAAPVAEYLRQHTTPTDTIMVFGSEPEIYFYAHRHSASGFIYTYSLVEDQAYWPAMQKQMVQEVEANRPAYVVFVNTYYSWGYRPGSPQVNALGHWMDQYVAYGFEEVGIAELAYLEPSYSNGFSEAGAIELADLQSRYFWGDDASGHRRPFLEVRVFKRKG